MNNLKELVCDLDAEPDEIYGGRWVNEKALKQLVIKIFDITKEDLDATP